MNTITFTLDDKKVCMMRDSIIEIQLGYRSSAYKTKYVFTAAQISRAIIHYNSINVGKGYKKRLRAQSLNKPILARHITT